jgi:hypothetical protein
LWVVVIAAVTVAAVGVGIALSTRNSRTVPVVGDSITVYSRNDISRGLKGAYHAEVTALIGQRIDQMLPALRNAVQKDPFAVIENLGTNDALQGRKHPDWKSGFTRMVALLAPARCVVLTTINTLPNGSPSAVPSVASDINRAIAEAAASHPNFHVADWNAAVHGADGARLLVDDQVHPSGPGQLVLAALYRSALDRDCRDK